MHECERNYRHDRTGHTVYTTNYFWNRCKEQRRTVTLYNDDKNFGFFFSFLIQNWFNFLRFNISLSKTVCIHASKNRCVELLQLDFFANTSHYVQIVVDS